MKIITETLKFDLCNVNLLNKNFCVAKDALDTKGFGTLTEMLMNLMLHPSINKYKNSEDLKNVTMKLLQISVILNRYHHWV